MSMLDEMESRLKNAMKSGDKRIVQTLRMVKAKVTEHRMSKDFSGELDDGVVQQIVGAYVKQLTKAIPEFEKAGDAGKGQIQELRFEIDYLSEFLPSLLDEAATRGIVKNTISEMGVSDPKRVGQVMGAIMKTHKGEVEPSLVRRIVEEELTPSSEQDSE